MFHKAKMTKRDERREMQKLMKERDKHNPARPSPGWVHDFWASRQSMLS